MTDVCKAKVPVPGTERQLRWCGRTDHLMETEQGLRCPQHAPPPSRTKNPQRVRAIIECDKLTLTRDERHELAGMLVGHEGSWKNLAEADARRIADGAHAFLIIQALLLQRRAR